MSLGRGVWAVGHHHLGRGAVVEQRQPTPDSWRVPGARLTREIREALGESALVLGRQLMGGMRRVRQLDGGVYKRAAAHRMPLVGQRREQLQQPGSGREV